jgi:ribosomal protein S18 acetylase RimI-like enzyme
MISYRLLSQAHIPSLYDCFLAAFSDYQVDMRMSHDQFQQRIVRDGVQLEMSAGAFDENRMIGFYMNASGVWQGKSTAYDAGTGVIPQYRGRGIAKELFAFTAARLEESGIDQYLLEVLTSNEPAVSLYRRLGFVTRRVLDVFRADKAINPVDLQGLSIHRVEQPDWKSFQSFWDGYPSWQNSIDAVERIAGERIVVGAYVGDACVGYGAAFPAAASLMQLAVAPAHRRKGIGSAVLSALQGEQTLKVNNIDEGLQGTRAFFEANGYKLVLKQLEMIKN